ncbi:MAG: glycosyltransferase [Chloroflexi bacterium]|nr:glycosyltransferase [Chloroflexota bacterium]
MKILHVYKNYFPTQGGIENHVRLLCRELVGTGEFEVNVLVASTGRATTREVLDGVTVVRAGQQLTLARTPMSLRLWWEVARSKADITHLHFPYPMGELAHLLFGRSPGMVMTYHSDIVSQKRLLRLYEPMLQRVLARADRLIATSPNYVRSSRFLSKHAEKCVVIPLGVDIERFENVDSRLVEEIRRVHSGPLLLFVGLFRYYKGLQHLIKVMPRIPARLLLVGGGPQEEDLKRLVIELGLQDKVVFAGEVGDEVLPAYYHACDVFVLPATHRSEAFGTVLVEAMACGKPVVCTDVGTGTTWVNLHGETGLVVAPANSDALVDAITDLLADHELRARMGRAARARAERELSKEMMVERTAEVYREVHRCSRRTSAP